MTFSICLTLPNDEIHQKMKMKVFSTEKIACQTCPWWSFCNERWITQWRATSDRAWADPTQGSKQQRRLLSFISKLCVCGDINYDALVAFICALSILSLLLQALLFSLILAFVQRGHDDSTVLPSPCTFSALHCRCGHKSQPKSQWLP